MSLRLVAQDRPNILWLVVEDMSPYLSFYGNPYTHTPTIDQLAAEGLIFDRAYSNGVQCSPARSTLISGIYAPMLSSDWHREARNLPTEFFYPHFLKTAGYYCTNNAKQDYNARNTPKDLWDASNKKATYLNRPNPEQPFFAVFNYNGTHTQRIATRDTLGRYPRRVEPVEITVPPYLPDIPRIRDDIAWHYDSVSEMDAWVAKRLADLEASGEADNTIVFFYSDHGGCLPRAKAFVYETGARIPLVVHFPERWKALAGTSLPGRDDRLVGFIDFAPTVLNMIGAEIPEHMLGQAFLGPNQPAPKEYLYQYRTNQESNFIPSRAITDGRYHLIVNFNTASPNGARQSYQWQMPSYQAWDEYDVQGKTVPLEQRFWQPMEALEFYDLQKDPYEVRNLVEEPYYQPQIQGMLRALIDWMIEQRDLGLYPWSMRERSADTPFYHRVRAQETDVKSVILTAFFAALAEPTRLPHLLKLLEEPDPAIRYWASIGLASLQIRGLLSKLPAAVAQHWADSDEAPEVRLTCAAMLLRDQPGHEALDFVVDQVAADFYPAYATLQQLGPLVAPATDRLEAMLQQDGLKHFYLRSALINVGKLPYRQLYPRSSQ